ncbi:dTDP-4-dehydrorhamnose 3,5-epimerase [Candidatus Pelagibacter sp.]|jgi:dTDP-4-dehydrorhamnose 3,5-epimerase|nr:dTDP-4-dehydrorhamnose 3,5-epimerase [Candidatus Pelagibacter sp.]|tara:strand:+ start:295 stop:807 length:513 start_codon:yes stop_codon:yes gene_type:complete
MKLIKTNIKDLLIIKTNIYKDHRGFFKEIEKYKILKKKFIFDCLSFSKKNTLRGLHLQRKKSQAKIITVAQGKILDVVVDLRKKSKTYGKHFSIKMSHDSDHSLFIPEGFAHGFLCLSKTCLVYYKCTNYRDQESEITLKWNDKDLKIKWPIKNPILSKKDRLGIILSEY